MKWVIFLVFSLLLCGCASEEIVLEKEEIIVRDNCNDVLLKVNEEIKYGNYSITLKEVWSEYVILDVGNETGDVFNTTLISNLEFTLLNVFLNSISDRRMAEMEICSFEEIIYGIQEKEPEPEEESTEDNNFTEEDELEIYEAVCNKSFFMKKGEFVNYGENKIELESLTSTDVVILVNGDPVLLELNTQKQVSSFNITLQGVFYVGTDDEKAGFVLC